MRLELGNCGNDDRQASASLTVSRRQLLNRAIIAAVGGLAVLGIASPALAKMTQQAAGYQTSPKNDQKCSGCALFKAPSTCIMIDGTISPDGWCRVFTKKSS